MFKKSAAPAAGGYTLSKSLRFRSSATAYLNRTLGTATNANKWTYSIWVKRSNIGSFGQLLYCGDSSTGNDQGGLYFRSGDQLAFYGAVASTLTVAFQTNALFRDPAAWYHIVMTYDSTQATAANRLSLYINGVLQTFATATYPTQNTSIYINTSSYATQIGRLAYNTTTNFDGYMSEVNFIDGQALTPSSFGSNSGTGGVWQPKKYTGSYGTNGFYLKFTDTTSTTTLCYDYSGNSNNWTPNNISLTAGTTYDSMTDVPTLTSATVANYCVMNPLWYATSGGTLTNGNLYGTSNASTGEENFTGTMALPTSGKFYWESTITALGVEADIGVCFGTSQNTFIGGTYRAYRNTGQKGSNSGGFSSYGSSFTTGDVIGVAVDMGAGTIVFYKNNTSQGTAYSDLAGISTWLPMFYSYAGGGINANFGQQPFVYTPPSGFVALNTYNLTTPTIAAGNQYMDATLYTGTGANLTVTNTGSFKPDLVWVKSRSAATDNKVTDSNRGATKAIISNSTAAETTDTNGLTAFNTNGFALGTDSVYNTNTSTYVGWQWQAGQGSTSSNTNGSITSNVSVSTTGGFSVVTYAGTGANATVGHGLGVAPQFIIVKNRTLTDDWCVYSLPTGAANYAQLNLTSAFGANSTIWNNTAPTSSVFSVGTYLSKSGSNYVAYCWTPIAGFSSIGSYDANNSTNGPFVYTGFRPKYVLVKCYGHTADWIIWDTTRNPYNESDTKLSANTSSAEYTGSAVGVDILSNGFKLRSTDPATNSVDSYIYAAFAENPFKYALAR